MLRHTFCHLPGVGAATEQGLWRAGITSWEHALESRNGSSLLRRLSDELLRESLDHHRNDNSGWFGRRLPAGQAWRLYHDFRHSCAYLDVETTGLPGYGHITTVALYDGRSVRTYVRGQSLDRFGDDVRDYRLLVTYNGKSFDVPFLARDLGVCLEQPHIDLRHLLAGLGLKGGLKSCERQLGLSRPGMEEVDGFVAVLLWDDFVRTGDPRSLETLLAYNVQDVLTLEPLLVHACNRKLAALAGASFTPAYHLPPPAPLANPHRADGATLRRVLQQYRGPMPFWR